MRGLLEIETVKRSGHRPLVSVVVPIWNSADFIHRCLSSVSDELRYLDGEVIVVDNGSRDEGPILATRWPFVRLIENSRNLGIAVAKNQGLRIARGRYCVLLDVDTVVTKGALQILVDFMESNPDVGLVGPKLVSPDGQLQYTCRNFPTVLSKIARRLPGGWSRILLEEEELRRWDHASPATVDYVIGACQMIRRSALNDVGLLDEKMFYGPDDVDICLRMWERGWEVYYIPSAIVIHWEQRVTKRRFSPLTLRHVAALVYYFLKHRYFLSRDGLYRRLGMPGGVRPANGLWVERRREEWTHPSSRVAK